MGVKWQQQGWKGVSEVHCSRNTGLARTHNRLEHEKSNIVLLQRYIDLHFLMGSNVFLLNGMYTHSRLILHLGLLTSELLKKREQPEFYTERIFTPTRTLSLVEGCESGHIIYNCTAQAKCKQIMKLKQIFRRVSNQCMWNYFSFLSHCNFGWFRVFWKICTVLCQFKELLRYMASWEMKHNQRIQQI